MHHGRGLYGQHLRFNARKNPSVFQYNGNDGTAVKRAVLRAARISLLGTSWVRLPSAKRNLVFS